MESLGALAVDCGVVAEQLSHKLAAAGLRVTRSFDLQSARQALRDPQGCPCPHHGTADCTCQYVVLLVDGGASAPLTLVAHGHDGRTHLSMNGPVASAADVGEVIRAAISELAALESAEP